MQRAERRRPAVWPVAAAACAAVPLMLGIWGGAGWPPSPLPPDLGAAQRYAPDDERGGDGIPGGGGGGDPGWKTVHMYVGRQPSTLGKTGQLHSQFAQDWDVATLMGCKRRGYFVELAANDAEFISNSLMLERDFAWGGLCIEPNTRYYYGHGHRKSTLVSAVVASPADRVVTFNMAGSRTNWPSDGGIVGDHLANKRARRNSVKLPTVAFEQVLRRVGAPALIDYLSLDVEGAEEEVMRGFPFGSYAFSVVTVERPSDRVVEQLRNHSYHFLRFSTPFGDQIWISERLPSFGVAMRNFTELLENSCMTQLGYERPEYVFSSDGASKKQRA